MIGLRPLLAASLVLLLQVASPAVAFESDSCGQWQTVTKQNFSSQIRLHPHVLLIVTVPWSGESRSLTREVSELITDMKEEFGDLKLMLLYRNMEKMLADVVGATEEITVLYYHHSISYKYRGRLRARNILSAVNHCMSLLPEELPLKALKTTEDLNLFLESTDKAVLLTEFCGWTPKLLAREKKNGTEIGILLSGNIGETNPSPTLRENNNQKVAEQDLEGSNMKCGTENEFGGLPWVGEFTSGNDSAPHQRSDSMSSDVGLSCTFEEFQRFESFFSKFMTLTRDFFLPPEKHRFGLVSERSLLSSLGVGGSESWSVMLQFAGCTTCSKILKDGDELKGALQKDNPIVRELDGDGHDLESALPAEKPSILLFVDRSFNLSETRRESKEALYTFRELALHHQISNQKNVENSDKADKSLGQYYQSSRSTSGHPRLKISPMDQKKLKDKTSVVIIKDGKQIAIDDIVSDLQGKSLQEILAYILQQKKEDKLSTLAKEVGFQLLSDDFNIKLENPLVSQTEEQPTQVSSELSAKGKGDIVTNSIDPDNDQLPYATGEVTEDEGEKSHPTNVESSTLYDVEKTGKVDANTEFSIDPVKDLLPHATSEVADGEEEKSRPTNIESSTLYDVEKMIVVDANTDFITIEPKQFVSDLNQVTANDGIAEETGSLQVDNLEGEQINSPDFTGSFLFSDGNYQLLRALTGGSKIPSVVIVDPISEQHYVFPEESVLSYSSLAGFLDGFLTGSLLPYQRSEHLIQNPREATRPPFVNVDFHEVYSIPRVTSQTFHDLVLGLNQSDTGNAFQAWNEDVLVLFTNSWCGFCQRMELVVREVYRAIKGYMNMLESGSGNGEARLSSDKLKDAKLKLPHIYLMDCTLNDCGLLLRSMGQRDVYPTLMMFPAEGKNPVFYDGDMAVADVIKFMADHGSCSHHLISDKGILRVLAEKGGKDEKPLKVLSPTAIHVDPPVEKELHKVLSENRTPEPSVVAGSTLIAAENLAYPFDKSTILIVKVDQNTGFLGLITNRLIGWDSLLELDQALQLLKEAPLSFGGPLIQREMPLIALTRRNFKDKHPEILPGVYFLDQVVTLNEIEELKSGNQSVKDYWFFLGYASWGWDQLFNEMAEGAWTLGGDSTQLLEWPEVG